MRKIKFNEDWRFTNVLKETKPIPVTLPHDAMQTQERISGLKNGDAMGYYPGGKYRYEKTFSVGPGQINDTCILEFEGIYQKSAVYLNDEYVGGHIYGYTDFFVDLTGKLKENGNVLRVEVDDSQTPNSRWYSGSGIYRDVYLHIGPETDHILPQGIRVTTDSIDPAVLKVSVDAVTSGGTEIRTQVSYRGKNVAQASGAEARIVIPQVHLWSAETPELYDVKVCLYKNGLVLDESEVRTGIRMISWSHEAGLMVNGRTTKLMGGCVHHDHGPIGACSFYTAEKRRVQRMKDAGFNAIRYAHNPAGLQFLRACDEVGMYVMDEAFDMWDGRKSNYDYGLYFPDEWEGDLSAMIRTAYNHPSVVLYSIGNEIADIGVPGGAGIERNRQLVECCHRLDSSRPVLNALSPSLICMAAKGIGLNPSTVSADDAVDPYEVNKNDAASVSKFANIMMNIGPLIVKIIGSPKTTDRLAKDVIDVLDITGYNYGLEHYDTHRRNHPDCIICGSETFAPGIVEHWSYVEQHPEMIGEFVWTAWDYLGETGVGVPRYEGRCKEMSYPYPCISASCGCFDLLGHLEGQGAHVLSVWGKCQKPYIGVRPPMYYGQKVKYGRWRNTDAIDSWSWDGCEGMKTEVQVFASGDAVELYQDGRSLGRRTLQGAKACYVTTYQPGSLKAEVYDREGNLIGSNELVSAVGSSSIAVSAEQESISASEKDIVYVDIQIVGDNSAVKTTDDRKISVTVEGPGELIGLGSANPLTEELFTQDHITTYHGNAAAIIRATGEPGTISVVVKSSGLEDQAVFVSAY